MTQTYKFTKYAFKVNKRTIASNIFFNGKSEFLNPEIFVSFLRRRTLIFFFKFTFGLDRFL